MNHKRCIILKVTLRAICEFEMVVRTSSLTIGALVKASCVPAPTIRYYEKIALLPEAERSRSNQRRYDRGDVERLNFIRRCRAFGFSIKQVRSLLAVPNGSIADCLISKELAQDRIKDIRSKVSDLLALEAELKAVIDHCQANCCDRNDKTCGAFVEMQEPSQKT
jgi:MerR family copper efflux transcriptional regulator